ncbi:type VII toxin-antitoxin system MntA family adenylyltransferase antitoxin [Actinomycetospora chiangmaiensis]|uniref:type VII toxin-antitoxin system MntA family adenylyltransferase antitoxin n=1 Tax=Actinomycetospora chiangmaiensis TaxID=402650 RepID=UPI0003786FF6|nr:nucleotidyltransferase domain-containing protein [Actinomycetospora chiangmaiensis]
MENDEIAAALRGRAALVGVELLVLHGSRARGDAGPTSDWDVGYQSAPGTDVDPAALLDVLSSTLVTDAVDLVDLRRASALLRFRAARDGVALVEARPEVFLDFRLEAVRFWCDAEPVIRAAQAEVLASLG